MPMSDMVPVPDGWETCEESGKVNVKYDYQSISIKGCWVNKYTGEVLIHLFTIGPGNNYLRIHSDPDKTDSRLSAIVSKLKREEKPDKVAATGGRMIKKGSKKECKKAAEEYMRNN